MSDKQTDFVDGVTPVVARWLDTIQEVHQSAGWNLNLAISGESVVISAGSSEDTVSLIINGKMRYVQSPVSTSLSGEADGTYGIFAITTGDDDDTTFTLDHEAGSNTPGGSWYRKIATVEKSGTTLSNIKFLSPYTKHASQHLPGGNDPLPNDIINETNISNSSITEDKLANESVSIDKLAEAVANALVPVSTIFHQASATIPDGYLEANGQAVSRTTYSNLFSAIGTAYGAGDGSTTFNLPDARGKVNMGAGAAPGLTARALTQVVGAESLPAHVHSLANHVHSMQGHTHGISHRHNITHTHPVSIQSNGGGGHTPAVQRVNGTGTDGNYFPRGATGTPNADSTGIHPVPDHVHDVIGNTQGSSRTLTDLPDQTNSGPPDNGNTGTPSTGNTGNAGSGTHGVIQPSLVLIPIIKY